MADIEKVKFHVSSNGIVAAEMPGDFRIQGDGSLQELLLVAILEKLEKIYMEIPAS